MATLISVSIPGLGCRVVGTIVSFLAHARFQGLSLEHGIQSST